METRKPKRNEQLEKALKFLQQDAYASPRALHAIAQGVEDAGISTSETALRFAERMKGATNPREVHRQLVDDARAVLRKLEQVTA